MKLIKLRPIAASSQSYIDRTITINKLIAKYNLTIISTGNDAPKGGKPGNYIEVDISTIPGSTVLCANFLKYVIGAGNIPEYVLIHGKLTKALKLTKSQWLSVDSNHWSVNNIKIALS